MVPVAVRSAGAARELLKERLFGSLSAISAGQRQGGNLESRRIAFRFVAQNIHIPRGRACGAIVSEVAWWARVVSSHRK